MEETIESIKERLKDFLPLERPRLFVKILIFTTDDGVIQAWGNEKEV